LIAEVGSGSAGVGGGGLIGVGGGGLGEAMGQVAAQEGGVEVALARGGVVEQDRLEFGDLGVGDRLLAQGVEEDVEAIVHDSPPLPSARRLQSSSAL